MSANDRRSQITKDWSSKNN